MNTLVQVLRDNLPGPRWDVTRDVVRDQPGSAADTTTALSEDLRNLRELLGARDSSSDKSHVIDMRISVEHIVLLLGRLIPALNAVAADLYMTDIADLEKDEYATVPCAVRSLGEDLVKIEQRWQALQTASLEDKRQKTIVALDLANTAADLNTVTLRMLGALLRERV